jgi:hypothetical protein
MLLKAKNEAKRRLPAGVRILGSPNLDWFWSQLDAGEAAGIARSGDEKPLQQPPAIQILYNP